MTTTHKTRSNADRVTTDRFGHRCYVWVDGTVIAKDGVGRMCWTVYYSPEAEDYGMVDSLAEALAWANV